MYCFALSLALLAFSPRPVGDPSPEASAPLLEHVAFLGASVTVGFGTTLSFQDEGREIHTSARLADALKATLPSLERTSTHADLMLYLQVEEGGERLLREAAAARPSCVVALDYLFWYAYGSDGDRAARLAFFERGLSRLAELSCPVFVGDLPDVRSAPGLEQAPAPPPDDELLEACRDRLLAWAAEDERRHVIELARLVAAAQGDGVVEVGGVRWPAASRARWFTEDGLHPTAEGVVPLARMVAFALTQAPGGPRAEAILAPEDVPARLTDEVRMRRRAEAAEKKARREAARAAR